MNLMIKKCFFAALFFSVSFSSVAESTDARLVGNWQGQRSQECIFMAWKIDRTADGKFELTFFGDTEKKQVLVQAKGRWKAKNGKLSLLTDGVPTPDIYIYTFIDDNTVNFSSVKRDPSNGCMADYKFTEHRVSQ